MEEFPIGTRTINVLKRNGYETEGDFKGAGYNTVKELEGLGLKGFSELTIFLKGRGISLKKEKKEKSGPKYHPRSKELATRMLPKGEFSFAVEIPAAHKLIELYGFDNVTRVDVPGHVKSLRYFLAGVGGWMDRKVAERAPMRLVEVKEEVAVEPEEEIEQVAYKPAAAPIDLKTFLGLRR